MKSVIYLPLTLTLLLLVATPALWAQQDLPEPGAVDLPQDLSRVHFYLITVDAGNNVWDNFGHTALRMVDENNNTDTVFNWGLFDVSGGVIGFSWNFFKGIMNYQLGTATPQTEFSNYRNQQRTVWQDQINLSNQQKSILYRRLAWNIRPDNVVYAYDYFNDNCTTRVRDYLDEALSGRISESTATLTANTHRDLVKYHYRSRALVEFSLDVLMNSNIDRPITQWEEMFLPMSLRNRLLSIPADVARGGERVNILSGSEVIMEFPSPVTQPNPYYLASGFLIVPLALLLLMSRRQRISYFSSRSKIALRAPGLSFRILGLLGLVISLFSGVYGCLMLGGWFFSGHEDVYSNLNLLLFWPTDLAGIVIAGHWLLFAKPWPVTHNSAPFVYYYLLAKVLSLLTYMVIAGLGLSDQTLTSLFIYVVPGLFVFTIITWLVAFDESSPRNMFT